MSRMSDLYIELQDYVFDAIEQGAACEADVIDYLNTHHPDFPIPYDEDLIADIVEDVYLCREGHGSVQGECYGHA